jgi:hypothetical protein
MSGRNGNWLRYQNVKLVAKVVTIGALCSLERDKCKFYGIHKVLGYLQDMLAQEPGRHD